MPKKCYIEKKFSKASAAIIKQANAIIEEYQKSGFSLTLRQLYYQFVSRDLIANKVTEYSRLGAIISDARLAGLIDWESIIDRTRNLASLAHWTSPQSIISACAEQYRIDKWMQQPVRLEVWVEKEALIGVVKHACDPLDVPHFACKGYTSQSEMWEAGQRILRYKEKGQDTVIIHLGDHDPSGIDMTRDITDRLQLFMGASDIQRIALNWDQIEKYKPPPNPAKTTDSRFESYESLYGTESWELDAIDPSTLSKLITDKILEFRDEDAWEMSARLEDEQKDDLYFAARHWKKLVENRK